MYKILIVCFFLSTWFHGINAQTVVSDSVTILGNIRHFKMILPNDINIGAPLVFVLHGYGDSSNVLWMHKAAQIHGFALCIPIGLTDLRGNNSWNVGYPFQKEWKINDVWQLCKLANYVQEKYKLSKENTFMTGMSNGGEMCYLMAYSKQNTFKAFASISGLTLKWMYYSLEAPCGMPIMEVHGTEDRISEWYGDLNNVGGWGAYLPVEIAIDYWVAKNRCTYMEREEVEGLNLANQHMIECYKYKGAANGNEVWLYKIVGGGHSTHVEDIDTGEEVWKFFSLYLR